MGGAELLFLRSARYLCNLPEYKIFYVDYNGGYAIENIEKGIPICHLEYDGENAIEVPEDSVIITPLSFLPIIYHYIHKKSDIHFLFWSINPLNLASYVNLYRMRILSSIKKRSLLGKYIKILSEQGIIRYMDHNNYYTNSIIFNFQCNNVEYLPIFTDDYLPYMSHKRKEDGYLNFLWLGRFDIDKYKTIATFFNELEIIAKKLRIRFYLVGGGSKETYLKNLSSKCSFETIFMGRVIGKELDTIIEEKIDVGLAMGTSSLDIAKHRKPVILKATDHISEGDIERDYIWLYESKDYDIISPGYYDPNAGRPFKKLIEDVVNNYDKVSQLCYNHVSNHFFTSSVGLSLKKAIEQIEKSNNISINETIDSFSNVLYRRSIKETFFLISANVKNRIFKRKHTK